MSQAKRGRFAYGVRMVKTESWPVAESVIMSNTSSNNFIPALVSFFIPGLGQLIQGRLVAALLYFVISIALWFFFLGWLGHIVACIDAARWKGR